MSENLQQSPLVRSIANQQNTSASVSTQAPMTGGLGTPAAPGPAPATPIPPVNSYAATIIAKIEALSAKVEAIAAKDEGYVKKYWPIAAGAVIALTRFLHL